MKTIKKHIGLWATMAALLTGACTTYPDDFGFSADLADTQVEYTAFRPTGYDITVKTPIANFDEGAGITQVGYTVNGEERHCEPAYSEVDGCYCLTISLQDLQFSQVYNIQPFIGDDNYQNKGNTKTACMHKFNFRPTCWKTEWTMNANKEVIWKAHYSCAAPGYRPVESATATVEGKNIKATISNDGQIVSVNLGNVYEFSVGDHSNNVTVAVTNAFGNDNKTSPETYDVTISETTARFPDDGVKDDCIRVCGINWAKGLFYYDKTTKRYGIATKQWSCAEDLGDTHFLAANGHRHESIYTDIETDIYKIESKGDRKYDMVTQYINTWGTPSYSDFRLLVDNASIQACNVINESGKSIPGYLFLFPSDTGKRFVSGKKRIGAERNTSVNISYKDIDKLGLFLANDGCISDYNSFYKDFYYMSSTLILNFRGEVYFEDETVHYNSYIIEKVMVLYDVALDWTSSLYLGEKCTIRPVKL